MLRSIFYFLLALCATNSPAFAAWHEASSDHFVIYADQSADDIHRFAERLERYHEAMRAQFGHEATKPSPSNRVTVYVVKNGAEVKALYGGDFKFVGGFYRPKAGGSFAIIPRVDNEGRDVSQSEMTLFHEYAHHYLISASDFSYPLWVTEGFAEFYASSKFDKDGSVGLGLPAAHRAGELMMSKNVPAKLLIDTKAYLATRDERHDEFYGRSWLLFHMLRFDEARRGQLRTYLTALQSGQSEVDAANASFGDLAKLEKDMDAYMRRRKLPYFKIAADKMTIAPIAVRSIDSAEADAMPLRMKLKVARNKDEFAAIVPPMRTLAAQHPSSAEVQALLAEAELAADNGAEALVAADAAVALDKKSLNGQLQRAFALANLAPDSDKPEAAWSKARAQFVKVNRMENSHPVPLIWYFRSYVDQGQRPDDLAIAGLELALTLAPFDLGLRMNVAKAQLNLGRFADARSTALPLASNPHNAGLRQAASELIALLDRKLQSEAKGEKPTDEEDAVLSDIEE